MSIPEERARARDQMVIFLGASDALVGKASSPTALMSNFARPITFVSPCAWLRSLARV
jgi:hypothetical protein